MRIGRARVPRPPRSARRAGIALALVVTAAACAPQEAAPPLAVAPTTAPALPGARAATAPATAPAGSPASCVDAALARLEPRERAGQLVMSGVPADGVTGAVRTALAQAPGGIVLTDPAGGGDASRAQVEQTVRTAQATARRAGGGVGLLVSADQEGGEVQELAGAGFDTIPSALAQGRDPAGLRADARTWGGQLAGAGVQVDLAPVADVVDPALGKDNAPVGALDRGFGTDPDRVGPAVASFVGGMDDAGVSATLKHFPGLGKVRQNTDYAGAVTDTATRRDDPDLASFRDGIEAGAGLVMMSSARYTKLDPDHLALFSPTIMRDLLRDDLGFRGVIMTDDVGAASALADVPVGRRATDFVAAGGDLVLTVKPADAAPMVDALARKAAADPSFGRLVDDSARRVLALKQQRRVLACG